MQSDTPIVPRLFTFVGDSTGAWRVHEAKCIVGAPLPVASRVSVVAAPVAQLPQDALWTLRGITSNERYVESDEKSALIKRQEGLGRPASTLAALIPIRKTSVWWTLAQDERRHIFEAQSHHIATGLKYLPAVARRLHHCRDLGPSEPFDFLTWFEYPPSDSAAFDELVMVLRSSPEWEYVDREIDIRLGRPEA